MKNPKISVIVPIYNAEKYLAVCLDSLISQTYKNLELILVDDGSNAATKEILETYAGKPGVSIYHKENGGLSDARNFGLRHATGDYIAFVDADDILHPQAYSRCVQALEQYDCDLLVFSQTTFYGKQVSRVPELPEAVEARYLSSVNAYDHFMANCRLGGTATNKLWRRDVIGTTDFKTIGCEDAVFVWDTLCRVHSFAMLPDLLYYYRYVPTGLSKLPNVQKMMACFDDFCLLEQRSMQSPSLEGIRRNLVHWALKAAESIVLSGEDAPKERALLKEAVSRVLPTVHLSKVEQLEARAFLFSWHIFCVLVRFIFAGKRSFAAIKGVKAHV